VARTWASQSGLSQTRHGSKFGASIGLKGASFSKLHRVKIFLRLPHSIPPAIQESPELEKYNVTEMRRCSPRQAAHGAMQRSQHAPEFRLLAEVRLWGKTPRNTPNTRWSNFTHPISFMQRGNHAAYDSSDHCGASAHRKFADVAVQRGLGLLADRRVGSDPARCRYIDAA
jgi:hypothetical protein